LAAHWNLGEERDGYTPSYQLNLIRNGHYLIPSFLMPNFYADPADKRWIEYYEEAILTAARWRLPIALIGTQWEAPLSTLDEYPQLPADQNPNVIQTDGRVRREVSPFGAIDPWRQIGRRWGSSRMMQRLQELYPEPPLVLLISNNEHARLDWTKVEEDQRYAFVNSGTGRDGNFKRRLVGDAWIERYRTLQRGISEGLILKSWRDRVQYVAYDAFGPAHFARWPGGSSTRSSLLSEPPLGSSLGWNIILVLSLQLECDQRFYGLQSTDRVDELEIHARGGLPVQSQLLV
jgi:hypothetical protein